MGCLSTKHETANRVKHNKNHKRRKMFNLGIGIERGDITISAHTQIGYASTTVKKYGKQNDEKTRKLVWLCLISLLLIPITVEVLLIVVTLKLLLQF
jgi:hypothetical protein